MTVKQKVYCKNLALRNSNTKQTYLKTLTNMNEFFKINTSTTEYQHITVLFATSENH